MNKLTEDFLRPFGVNQVMQLHSLILRVRQFGLTLDDIENICDVFIAETIEKAKNQQPTLPTPPVHGTTNQKTTRCPKCGSFCRISQVNVSKCTNVGGDWKTSIGCVNPDCRFTELSTRTINDWRNR